MGRIDEEQLFSALAVSNSSSAADDPLRFAAELTEAIRSDALREQVLARIGQGRYDIFSRTGSRRFSSTEPGGQRSAAGLSTAPPAPSRRQ